MQQQRHTLARLVRLWLLVATDAPLNYLFIYFIVVDPSFRDYCLCHRCIAQELGVFFGCEVMLFPVDGLVIALSIPRHRVRYLLYN